MITSKKKTKKRGRSSDYKFLSASAAKNL